MSKWNQENRVYCVMKDMRKVGERIAENTAMLTTHLDDMEHILECVEIYHELSRRLLCMTDGMMELANLSEQYRTRKREPFLLGHFFISMTGQLWPEAEKKGQCFLAYNGGVVHEHVIGDLQMLMKACSRIIRNEITYTGECKNITVQLTELSPEKALRRYTLIPSEVCVPCGNTKETPCGHTTMPCGNTKEIQYAHYQLQVKDDGQGMAPEEIRKALSLYPEGDFGLPVAERILGTMGGGLQIKSVPGTGTTVTADFFLELQNLYPSGEGELLGRKILIYEESNEEKEEVRRLFAQLGAECTAVCGINNLETCLSREGPSYDMVCIGERAVPGDLQAFIRYIRWKTGNRTCIILISSYNKETSVKAMRAGVDGYMQRPLFGAGLQALFQSMQE